MILACGCGWHMNFARILGFKTVRPSPGVSNLVCRILRASGMVGHTCQIRYVGFYAPLVWLGTRDLARWQWLAGSGSLVAQKIQGMNHRIFQNRVGVSRTTGRSHHFRATATKKKGRFITS